MPGDLPEVPGKSQAQLDFEAAPKAYKDLFVYSSSQSPEQVLAKLQVLIRTQGRGDFRSDMPINYNMLMSFNLTDEAKCNSYEYVSQLKDTYELVDSHYKPLRKYMRDCLDRQLDVCNFEQRFRARFDGFKSGSPGQWALIQEFNKQAERFGKRSSDWQSGALDNKSQMNEALARMARDHNKKGSGEDPARAAYQMANALRGACAQFDERLAAGLLLATIDDRAYKRNKREFKEWFKLMRVCRTVGRVSFEPALGDIFGHTYYPEAQKAWESYEDYRERWNL